MEKLPLDVKQKYLFFYLDLSSRRAQDDWPAIFAGRRGLRRSLIMGLNQRKIKFEPRIKLNHNIFLSNLDPPP